VTRPPNNIAASVKQRLLDLARKRGEDFNTLLARYAVERFLYRLSKSGLADRLILKGAMLFVVWRPTPHRPTRDLDLLGSGDSSPEAVAAQVRDILGTSVEDDGLTFDSDSVVTSLIREERAYGGVRATFRAMLGKARIDLQVDVGFGDAVLGSRVRAEYPSLLGFPAPVLRVYTRETVIAEKFHAMAELGQANSRMKDFYDILILSREFEFDAHSLTEAISATFERRGTPMPESSEAVLSPQLAADAQKHTQWAAFLKRLSLRDAPAKFEEVLELLNRFLSVPIGRPTERKPVWPAGGPWR
jgi:predicted nucleotidyltransferase component of viral defense system